MRSRTDKPSAERRLGRCRNTAMFVGVLVVPPCAAQIQPGEEPAAPAESQTCAGACHQDVLNYPFMHGPAEERCEDCHVLGNEEKHTFFLVAQEQDLCRKCHAIPQRNHSHLPVKNGACMSCHDPHGSDHKAMLLADPKTDLCVRCHERSMFRADYVHGPVVVGACVVCHEPHSSMEPALTREPEPQMCLTCHGEVERSEEAGWHTHGALREGCTGCHDPHAAPHPFQLKATAPDLCLSCHGERLHQQLAGASLVHGALNEPGGCTECHEAHGSVLPSLQRESEKTQCLDCHDRELKTQSGDILPNMARLLDENPDHHGPIREGACTVCHEPHSADRFRLLVEDYPPEFYAPFSIDRFKLCFRCHIPDLVLKEEGRGLTDFRNGTQNLHWLHVNREKGRTCRACHEVHASKHPAHIRESVPFGDSGWLLEINFTQTERGGACTPGCHQERSYDRGDSVAAPAPIAATRAPGTEGNQ